MPENGYENVGLLDIASKKISWLTKDKWEINGSEFSPDGKRVTWTRMWTEIRTSSSMIWRP